MGSGAIPDPTHLWWDLRLQPRFGTVEVRIMDAQIDPADTAALLALIQCLAAALRAEPDAPPGGRLSAEVLGENRFLAARDGMHARLIAGGALVEARSLLEQVVRWCEPHARDLRCTAELSAVVHLAEDTGADRQRRMGAEGAGPRELVGRLAEVFAAVRASRAAAPAG